jgi:hypothetical protein
MLDERSHGDGLTARTAGVKSAVRADSSIFSPQSRKGRQETQRYPCPNQTGNNPFCHIGFLKIFFATLCGLSGFAVDPMCFDASALKER